MIAWLRRWWREWIEWQSLPRLGGRRGLRLPPGTKIPRDDRSSLQNFKSTPQ